MLLPHAQAENRCHLPTAKRHVHPGKFGLTRSRTALEFAARFELKLKHPNEQTAPKIAYQMEKTGGFDKNNHPRAGR